MAVKAMVHVRVDEKIKAQAAETLAAMGLSLSDAVRVFLTRVAVEKELPFTLRVPNAETQAAMNEAEESAEQISDESQDASFDNTPAEETSKEKDA